MVLNIMKNILIIRKILNWPHTDTNGKAPWYLVLWRILWFPVIYLGWVISYLGIAIAFGLSIANRWLQDASEY